MNFFDCFLSYHFQPKSHHLHLSHHHHVQLIQNSFEKMFRGEITILAESYAQEREEKLS